MSASRRTRPGRPRARLPVRLFVVLCPLVTLLSGCDMQGGGRVDKSELSSRLQPLPSTEHLSLGPAWNERMEALQGALDRSLEGSRVDAGAVGDAYGAFGLHFMAHHQVEAASVCFANARQADPTEPRWPYLAGFLAQIQDRFEEAEEAYRAAVDTAPESSAARLRLATVLFELGRRDEAEELLGALRSDLRDRDERHAAVLYQLGRLRLAANDVDGAAELLEQVVTLDPSAGAARYALGQTYRRQGRNEEAAQLLATSSEREPRFDDPYLGELAELGVTPEFYRLRADAALAEGRFGAAVDHYEKMLELGANGVKERMSLAFALHGAARGAEDRDALLKRSAQQLEQALSLLGPEGDTTARAEVLHRLGNLEAEFGNLSEARRRQAEALALVPGHRGALHASATAAAGAGRHGEAVELLSQILAEPATEDPEASRIRARLYGERGASRLQLGEVGPGLEDLRQAALAAGSGPRPVLRYIEGLERFGAAGAAATAAREADLPARLPEDRLSFENQVTWIHLAHKMRRYGRFQDAADIYDDMLRRASASAEGDADGGLRDLRLNLADVLFLTGDFEKAAALYAEVSASEDHAGARYGEIRCRIASGDWAGAKTKLDAALKATQSGRLLHVAARLSAVAPPPLADPAAALEAAQQVFEARRSPDHAATVAMAMAAAGRFEEAAEWQRRLIADVSAMKGATEPMVPWLREQLQRYESGRPWRPEPASAFFPPEDAD